MCGVMDAVQEWTVMKMRLIDADAIRKELLETLKLCDAWMKAGKDDETKVIAQANWFAFLEAKLRLDNAPTIDAVPHWIPCGEKLPEPTQEVLVTGINGCVYTSRIVHGEFEYGGNIIAWMPLPEPYDGERKDNE